MCPIVVQRCVSWFSDFLSLRCRTFRFVVRLYFIPLDGSVFGRWTFRSLNFWELIFRVSRCAVIHYSLFPGLYAVLRDFLIRPLFFKLQPLYKVDEGRQSRSLCLAAHRTRWQLLPRCSRRLFEMKCLRESWHFLYAYIHALTHAVSFCILAKFVLWIKKTCRHTHT